jgi:hypothetical protein
MTERDALPLPDYDHLSVPSLAHRIRSLDESGLDALLRYERAHGDRLPVVQVLQDRLDQLGSGAEPTQGAATGHAPERPEMTPGGSKVTPESTPRPDIPPTESDEAKPPMRG